MTPDQINENQVLSWVKSVELMDVPIHIVHSDYAVLKEIEHISI